MEPERMYEMPALHDPGPVPAEASTDVEVEDLARRPWRIDLRVLTVHQTAISLQSQPLPESEALKIAADISLACSPFTVSIHDIVNMETVIPDVGQFARECINGDIERGLAA